MSWRAMPARPYGVARRNDLATVRALVMHPSGQGLDAAALACLLKRNSEGATPAPGLAAAGDAEECRELGKFMADLQVRPSMSG